MVKKTVTIGGTKIIPQTPQKKSGIAQTTDNTGKLQTKRSKSALSVANANKKIIPSTPTPSKPKNVLGGEGIKQGAAKNVDGKQRKMNISVIYDNVVNLSADQTPKHIPSLELKQALPFKTYTIYTKIPKKKGHVFSVNWRLDGTKDVYRCSVLALNESRQLTQEEKFEKRFKYAMHIVSVKILRCMLLNKKSYIQNAQPLTLIG